MAAHNFNHDIFPLEDVLNDIERAQKQSTRTEDDPVTVAPRISAQPSSPPTPDMYKSVMWGLVVAAAGLLVFT